MFHYSEIESKNTETKTEDSNDSFLKLEIITCHADARPLVRGPNFSAGYDISACENVIIKPNEEASIHTGIKISIPPQMFVLMTGRSSLYVKKKLNTIIPVSIIDPGFHDELIIFVKNNSDVEQKILAGERIAQLIPLMQIDRISFVEVDHFTLPSRGGGIGSTGKI